MRDYHLLRSSTSPQNENNTSEPSLIVLDTEDGGAIVVSGPYKSTPNAVHNSIRNFRYVPKPWYLSRRDCAKQTLKACGCLGALVTRPMM